MSSTLDKIAARIKAKRAREKKLTPKQIEARDAQLYDDGRAEMRRLLNSAEGRRALHGPGRPYFVRELERFARDIKPERVKWLRENLGEREAAFREGHGFEAWMTLKHLGHAQEHKPLTPKQVEEGAAAAREWLHKQRK